MPLSRNKVLYMRQGMVLTATVYDPARPRGRRILRTYNLYRFSDRFEAHCFDNVIERFWGY